MTEAHQPNHTGFDIPSSVAMDSSPGYRLSFLPPALFDQTTPMTLDGPVTIADQLSIHLAAPDHGQQNLLNYNTTASGDLIDQSNHHMAEHVVAVSPNLRYGRLNTLLGKGAFKVVHKAIDREEGYEVAWNVLQIGQENNKDIAHEIAMLKSVRHPNIIAFHDAWLGESKTEFVFVTELMTSGTLREYIRKLNSPNTKIVKRWSRQILKGLAYLHAHNPPIIHRDIKCDNIFINGAHGEIKIGDMGTAENMWLGNKKYTLIGTPEFMAPEMYDERGYSEKVDIYAFGMCLLEMVTGEYPYAECTNAAQVYKKVSQHIKPESLGMVQNQQVLEIICGCLSDENERQSAQELLEGSFLAVEPDVVLLATDPSHKILTLQVVFKGSDKLSVKFEFNVEKDTAEEVVAEMIEEQVLLDRYQHSITGEINRILRDMEKDASNPDKAKDRHDAVWRRENDIRTELERERRDLARMSEFAAEAERKVELIHQQMLQAEERLREVVQERDQYAKLSSSRRPSAATSPPVLEKEDERTLSDTDLSADETPEAIMEVFTDYADDTPIDIFVQETAAAAKRDKSKASEWASKLKDQDIMTAGDLRGLLDEDWNGLGLTVFARRALKNMLNHNRRAQKSTDASLED
ncbi:putative serine/threonine-specific protein kinase pkpA Phycomyces blakesleeanus [Phycomyces blakesleeanus]|uniref:Serine/threonine-specific protein kinase pkpA Phycomyces blakesleeanus n=1 Tax=Phycomyces blakesleeanus TaxID=4837 RepID=A0ABR3BGC0_PHYBL